MIQFDGTWWLPDGETHLQAWMTRVNRRVGVDGRLTYQYEKYEAALALCTERRVAIDVGAHVGLWSYWMARDFKSLFAFEPMPAHQECWRVNMAGLENAALFAYALGAQDGMADLVTSPTSSGDTYVRPADSAERAAMQVPIRRLDGIAGWGGVDLLKIDCEGFEYFVVQGAVETLATNSPVVVVEQKPQHATRFGLKHQLAAVALLKKLGYRDRATIHGDVILTKG